VVELAVLLFITVFSVFCLGIPVVTWASLRGLARARLVDELRASGALDVASRGDEDAERAVSLSLKMYGRAFQVEAVERGEIPLWHVRLRAAAGDDLCLARAGWRAPPSVRSLPASSTFAARLAAEPRLYTIARAEGRWLLEVERKAVSASDLTLALRVALDVVDPGARRLKAQTARPSGAPLALPSP
jgi:hypothetical protein